MATKSSEKPGQIPASPRRARRARTRRAAEFQIGQSSPVNQTFSSRLPDKATPPWADARSLETTEKAEIDLHFCGRRDARHKRGNFRTYSSPPVIPRVLNGNPFGTVLCSRNIPPSSSCPPPLVRATASVVRIIPSELSGRWIRCGVND